MKHFPTIFLVHLETYRNSHPEVFLGKGILKIWSKFTGGHRYRNVISIKLHWNFIEIALRHGCSPANLLHIFRTPFSRKTSGWLLLNLVTIMDDNSLRLFLVPGIWHSIDHGWEEVRDRPWRLCVCSLNVVRGCYLHLSLYIVIFGRKLQLKIKYCTSCWIEW